MKLLSKLSVPFQSFLFFLGAVGLDFASSMLPLTKGFHESNPFSRHIDGNFWPMHALGNFVIQTSELLIVCLVLFYFTRFISRHLALFLSSVPWLYYGYLHFDAAVSNLQVWLLYVPYDEDAHILSSLLSLLVK